MPGRRWPPGGRWPTPSGSTTGPWQGSTARGAAPCTRSGPSTLTVPGAARTFGAVGELHPSVVGQLGLLGTDGRPPRIGWIDLDLDTLLDPGRVPRRSEEALPVSRFPSSDIDLAFAVAEEVRAEVVERLLRKAGGDELESVRALRRLPGPVGRRGCPEPGLPAAVLRARPHPRRQRTGRRAATVHRRRRAGGTGHPPLNVAGPQVLDAPTGPCGRRRSEGGWRTDHGHLDLLRRPPPGPGRRAPGRSGGHLRPPIGQPGRARPAPPTPWP